MRTNDRGFVAMADAMLFMVIIMVATVVVVSEDGPVRSDDRDASSFLEALMSSEVRMSDLGEGDDSLVRLSDMLALRVHVGSEGTEGYIAELLDSYCRGRGYLLSVSFEFMERTEEWTLGDGGGTVSSSAERTVPVTSGGTLTAVLSFYRRGPAPPADGAFGLRFRGTCKVYALRTVFPESGSLRFPTIPSVSFFYLKRIDRRLDGTPYPQHPHRFGRGVQAHRAR